MGCIDRLLWSLRGVKDVNQSHSCSCSAPVPFDELAIKPRFRTPLDKLGFPMKCCFCCSTRVASGFIFLVSLIWACTELQCADKNMANVFPDRGAAFFYCKMVFIVILMGFVIACGSLLVGVIIEKIHPLHCFVWCGFIFNCFMVIFMLGTTTAAIMTSGDVNKQQTAKIVFTVFWSIFFFYLLMVVNSYKLKVWYRTLGFGL